MVENKSFYAGLCTLVGGWAEEIPYSGNVFIPDGGSGKGKLTAGHTEPATGLQTGRGVCCNCSNRSKRS